MCGDTTESDIALHVNPRFSERYLVQNHRLYGKWGPEATTGVGLFNLQRGKPFNISILVSEYQYMIAINGYHYATFPFKINVKKVGYVEVNGGVLVDKIEYTNAEHYPSLTTADILPPNLNFDEVYQHSGTSVSWTVSSSLIKFQEILIPKIFMMFVFVAALSAEIS